MDDEELREVCFFERSRVRKSLRPVEARSSATALSLLRRKGSYWSVQRVRALDSRRPGEYGLDRLRTDGQVSSRRDDGGCESKDAGQSPCVCATHPGAAAGTTGGRSGVSEEHTAQD